MPFDAEFKRHLHSLMVEVHGTTLDECVQHKNELLGRARATHNSAATPIAYRDAALYSMECRVRKTIEKYLEAVVAWGFTIDERFEREMVGEFQSLTAGPSQIQFPPAIRGPQVAAVQGDYARARARLANQLVTEGTNRLKELKMKNKRQSKPPTGSPTTNIFHAPVGNAIINSPHSSVVQTNNIAITTQTLNDIDQLSEGNAELHSAALELRHAHAKGGNVVDKLLKWVTLATAVSGLTEKIYQHYPEIAYLIDSLKHIGR